MRALRRQDPEAEFRFWGGDAMRAEAGEPVRHIRQLAIMGFVEVVLNLRTVLGNMRLCREDVMQYRPDVVVYIDYPGFNLKIAHYVHQRGLKNVHYISPQLWAWKKGRLKAMRHDLDRLCYILPFERDFYAKNSMPQAVYVGHPLLDAVSQFRRQPSFDIADGRRTIALLPGSRRQELTRVLPPMLRLAAHHPEYRFVIAGMTLIGEDFYKSLIGGCPNVEVAFDKTYSLLAHAYGALVCSGTATLETALFDVPQVVCYSANALSIAIARRLVGKRIKYISLVNLIADETIVAELIQQDLTDDRLEEEFQDIVSADGRQKMFDGYRRLRHLMGGAGASDRTAMEIVKIAAK